MVLVLACLGAVAGAQDDHGFYWPVYPLDDVPDYGNYTGDPIGQNDFSDVLEENEGTLEDYGLGLDIEIEDGDEYLVTVNGVSVYAFPTSWDPLNFGDTLGLTNTDGTAIALTQRLLSGQATGGRTNTVRFRMHLFATLIHELKHVALIRYWQSICSTSSCSYLLLALLFCHLNESGMACIEAYAWRETAMVMCCLSCSPGVEGNADAVRDLADSMFAAACALEAKCAGSSAVCGPFPVPPPAVYAGGGFCPGAGETPHDPATPPDPPPGGLPEWATQPACACDCETGSGDG